MKTKVIKVLILAVVVIICLSAGLYAAHSYSQAKVTTPSVTAQDDGPTVILNAVKENDRRILQKID